MSSPIWVKVLLLAIAVSMEISREICFKLAANKAPVVKAEGERGYLTGLFFRPLIWFGFFCWGIELVAWIMVLARIPLSDAFPVMSLAYCGMILAGKYILGEKVTPRKWLAMGLITIGVAIIGSQGIG